MGDKTTLTDQMSGKISRLGLIAGGGQFPILFARRAAEKGYRVYAVAYLNEADPQLEEHVQGLMWLHLGQVSKLVKFFKAHGVSEVVMLGSVTKTRIFRDIKPDLKAMAFIASKGRTHDDDLLRSFADLLAREGLWVQSSTVLLPEIVSPKGCWTKRAPDRGEWKDIEIGWRIAKGIGELDIGQCVVVGNGTILAVEGADGTDATIRRGGALGHPEDLRGASKGHKKSPTSLDKGIVLVKRSKPIQDLRFDLPAAGSDTVRTMIQSNVSVLVVEAGKSVAFDRNEMIALADQYGISIVALTDDDFLDGAVRL